MENQEPENLDKDRKRGLIWSISIHALLIVLFVFPILSHQEPPPEQEGVLVSFGQPTAGSGDDNPDTQNQEQVNEPSNPQEQSEAVEAVKPSEEQELDVPVKEQPKVEEDVLTSEDSKTMAVEEEKKKAAEAEAKRKAEVEAAKRKAEAEKAEQERKYREAKKQFGNVFGEGKGNTKSAGNQGDPDGDPDADKLKGISTGSGVVGGGLGDRGLSYAPDIRDRSQKAGKVVVNVCVNESGKVVSATYTQRGSTTTDRELREIAEENAKKFEFTESDIDKQCGTITIDFKLQ